MCDSLNIPTLYHPAAEMGTLAASLDLNSWIEVLGGGGWTRDRGGGWEGGGKEERKL